MWRGARKRHRAVGWALRALATALALLLGGGCAFAGGRGSTQITIGAVTFSENQIVAEMYAQVLEDAGFEVDRRFNFQNREALQPAMRSGSIDLSPEYLASLLSALDPQAEPSSNPDDNVAKLEPRLEGDGLTLLRPSQANNTNALVVDSETANRLDLAKVSDLEPVASRLTFGGPPECPQRRFCLQGLREVYGLRFKKFQPLDAGGPLTTAALSSDTVDVALLFTTSGIIAERGWVLLEDDRGLQAADNITPLIRSDALTDELAQLIDSVSARLTIETMTSLNARVEVRNENFPAVASDFLEDEDLI
ncbi:MAG: ABC transporter substrate-binding protein [Actinomycetota bacterium]